jgi:hypothetical protein
MTRELTVQVTVEIAEDSMSQPPASSSKESATGKKGAAR